MAKFDYSQLHYFDGKGRELPLIYNSPRVVFENPRFENEYGEYLVVTKTPDKCNNIYEYINNVALTKTKTGKRFLSNDIINCKYISESQTVDASIDNSRCRLIEYSSTFISKKPDTGEDMKECYIDDISSNFLWENFYNNGLDYSNIPFPSLYFSSKMYFKKVSTGLVESEAIYILAENPSYTTSKGANKYTTVSDLLAGNDTDGFLQRYQLMFFIDCREQNNFRFFTTNNSEIVWSDRKFIDFSADNNYAIGDTTSGFRVDIGFTGELEGVYEENMYIFLIDKSTKNVDEDYPGDAYLIGEIKMFAETEGEDERYRTFYDNFGIPDPKDTYDAFAETDINQESIDYMKINDYSKKMFLAYDQIFPYAGTYKALINTLKVLGYNDVFFKEWYKETGKSSGSGLVSYDISFNDNNSSKKHNTNLNTISNVPLEERIHLKKLNWVSMLYKMVEESSLPIDRFGFPTTEKVDNYYDNGTLVKLMSLRKYLEKYVLGVNCRITDIGGEGIVFERYNTYKFGTYQQNLEYTNEKSIAIDINDCQGIIYNDAAEIQAKIITTNSNISFSDMKNETFIDYCDGYICCDNNTYINNTENIIHDSSNFIYCGKTLELNDTTSRYEIRSLGECESFRFESGKFVTSDSPSLLIDDGKIIFDPKDLLNKYRNTTFLSDKLPIIQIKRGAFKEYDDNNELKYCYEINEDNNNNDGYSYVITRSYYNGFSTQINLKDCPTFIPPTFISDEHKSETITTDDDGNEIVVKSKQLKRTIKYKYKNTTKNYIVGSLKNWNDIDVINDFYYPNNTFGLRYSTDNPFNIPCFKIQGYALSEKLFQNNNTESDAIVPAFNEYCMEILEGKMIFNDTENNRKISLNFSQDNRGKVNISVSTIQYKEIDGTYKYKYTKNIGVDSETNETITETEFYNTLSTEGYYESFINDYKTYNYDNIIHLDSNVMLKFYNTGNYKISALMYDQCNNIFCSPFTKNVKIVTPDLYTLAYTLSPESDSVCDSWTFKENYTNINPIDDSSVCIYEYEPKRALEKNMVMMYHKTFDGNVIDPFYHLTGSYDNDTYTGLIHADNTPRGQYAQITNTLDKFIVLDKEVIHIDEDYCKIALSVKNETKYSSRTFYQGNKDTLLNDIDNYDFKHLNNAKLFVYNPSSEYLSASVQGLYGYDNTSEHFVFKTNDLSIIDILSSCSSEIYIIPTWVLPAQIEYTNGYNIVKCNELRGQNEINNNLYKLIYEFNGEYGSCIVLKNGVEYDGSIKLAKNVTEYTPDNETYKFYISPIDDAFVSYIMKLEDGKSTSDLITSDKSRESKKISQHIDKGFTASIREFDITTGHRWYNNGINLFEEKMYDTWYNHTGQIVTEGLVALKTGVPSGYYYCGTDGIGDWDDIIEIIQNEEISIEQNKADQSFRWRIYKQNRYNSSHKLVLECYNKYPVFYIDEKGVYDVEVTMFDRFGNKHERKSASAITVI